MNAQTEIQPYACEPSTFDHAAYHGFSPPPGRTPRTRTEKRVEHFMNTFGESRHAR